MTPLMNVSRILVLPAILSAISLTERVHAAEAINPTKAGGGASSSTPSGATLSPPKTGVGPTVPPPGVLNSPTSGPGQAPGGVLHANGPIEVPPINPSGPGSGIICCAVSHFPTFPTLLGQPDSVTSPYALQIMTGPTIVNSAVLVNNAASTANNLVLIHNPAVWFSFPVTPDAEALGAFDSRFKAIGFTGAIAIEACLSGDEAKNWPNLTPEAADPNTCPTEPDLVNDQMVNGNPTPGAISRAWYQVGFPAAADLYVTQNGSTVSDAGIVAAPVQLPVTLQQVLTPMRFHITNGAEYLYVSNHTGPNDYNAACPTPTAGPCLNYIAPVNFGHGGEFYTPPLNVVTLPIAMIQLKVVPRTILYLPPGNDSASCAKRAQTFSTTIVAGSTSEIDSSNSQDDWVDNTVGGGVTADIGKILSLGYSGSQDDRWDTKTTLKTGQALEHDVLQMNQTLTWVAHGLNSSKSAVPGAAGAFNNEPFWDDEVLVLAHPQLAVWNFSGRQSVQLIAASAGGAVPDEIGIPINQLDACARGVAPNAGGYSFPTATGQTETLSAAECKALAGLDPFYGKGQSAVLTSRGALAYGPDSYGVSTATGTGEGSDRFVSIGDVTSTVSTTTDTDTTTYSSTVEDIVATKWSTGITFGEKGGTANLDLGLKDQITLQQGSTSDTSQTMAMTYKDSSAQTYRIDVADAGGVDDTVVRAQTPYVEIYRDSLFGGFMFRDPYAACSPMPACQATAGPAGPIIAKPVAPVAVGRPPGDPIIAKPIQPVAVGEPTAPQKPVVSRSVQTCPSG
jgi:hypothetical protein